MVGWGGGVGGGCCSGSGRLVARQAARSCLHPAEAGTQLRQSHIKSLPDKRSSLNIQQQQQHVSVARQPATNQERRRRAPGRRSRGGGGYLHERTWRKMFCLDHLATMLINNEEAAAVTDQSSWMEYFYVPFFNNACDVKAVWSRLGGDDRFHIFTSSDVKPSVSEFDLLLWPSHRRLWPRDRRSSPPSRLTELPARAHTHTHTKQ